MADSIYWTSMSEDTIRVAPLVGAGTVHTLYDSGQGVSMASGLAIDPAAGQIYWSNYGDSKIQRAPLDGSGPFETLYGPAEGVSAPMGVAIDPAAAQIYWCDGADDGKIRRAPRDGGGPVQTLYGLAQGVFYPLGVAIEPAAGQIYWCDGLFDGKIRRGPLAGLTYGGTVETLYGSAQGVTGPTSVAIDSAAGRIYWSSNYPDSTIRSAPPVVGGTVSTLYDSGQGVWSPSALAIDPTPPGPTLGAAKAAEGSWLRNLFPRPRGPSGRIYWANAATTPYSEPSGQADEIRGAPLSGAGLVHTLYSSASWASALALLRVPLATGAPTISWVFENPYLGMQFGGPRSGPSGFVLSCTPGTWAADVPGCFLYRAPQSFAFTFQWRLDGTDIPDATSHHYTPSTPGSYTCQVTAINQAGSAVQTSAAVTVTTVP